MTKILVLVDVQNDFITGSLANPDAQKVLPDIIEKVKNWEGCIYTTMDTHYPYYLETFEGVNLPIEHCIAGTEGRDYPPELKTALKESNAAHIATIPKETFGSIRSFSNDYDNLPDDISSWLMDEEFEITLCGFCTDICVVSNALILRAYFPNTVIKVDSSCCAGTTPENHEAALKVMKSCQIDIE